MWSFQIESSQVEAVTEAHKNVIISIHNQKLTQRDVIIFDQKFSSRGSYRSSWECDYFNLQSQAHTERCDHFESEVLK